MKTIDHFISFAPPLLGEEEIHEVVDTLRSGWITTGPKTQRFEAMFADYVGAEAAVTTSFCTLALHLAMIGLGVKENDEVITTPFTFASTAHVILYQHAFPAFIDIEEQTYNIDPVKVEAFLKDCRFDTRLKKPVNQRTGRPVVGMLPVHYGGQPCEMEKLLDLAREYNLFVVEDAAHAAGAEYKGRKIGSFGDVTCFSFYATKNMTTGEGGMLTTNNSELAERLRVLTMYGISDARKIWERYSPRGTWDYDIESLGLKCNFTDIQASMGIHQLAKLDSFIDRRNEHAALYDERFSRVEGLTTPFARKDCRHARHLYPLLIDNERFRINRDRLIEALKESNIGTSVLFKPLHLHSYYRDTLSLQEGAFPVAESVFDRLINLPVSPSTTTEEVAYVAETVKEILQRERLR
jgi:dTDP-4-amino-4,6-dideoxygalactose transaminase